MARFSNIDDISTYQNTIRGWWQRPAGFDPMTDQEWAAQMAPPAGNRTGYFHTWSDIPQTHPEWESDPLKYFDQLEAAARRYDFTKGFPGQKKIKEGGLGYPESSGLLLGGESYGIDLPPEDMTRLANAYYATSILSNLVGNPEAEAFLTGRGAARAMRERQMQKTGDVRQEEFSPGYAKRLSLLGERKAGQPGPPGGGGPVGEQPTEVREAPTHSRGADYQPNTRPVAPGTTQRGVTVTQDLTGLAGVEPDVVTRNRTANNRSSILTRPPPGPAR